MQFYEMLNAHLHFICFSTLKHTKFCTIVKMPSSWVSHNKRDIFQKCHSLIHQLTSTSTSTSSFQQLYNIVICNMKMKKIYKKPFLFFFSFLFFLRHSLFVTGAFGEKDSGTRSCTAALAAAIQCEYCKKRILKSFFRSHQ